MRKLSSDMLKTLEENAIKASEFDKEKGDRWNRNHGVVVCKGNSICIPSYDKATSLYGYPPLEKTWIDNIARHIAGASPWVVLSLIREVLELRKIIEKGS